MSASGVVKRVRLGDEVLTYCGKCKEERTHQVMALNAGGAIERVTCLTCRGNHLYRGRQAAAVKKTGAGNVRAARAKPVSAASARAYAPTEVYAAGDVVSHPKFGIGEVVEARSGKIDVRFGGEKRTLLHAG